MNQSDAHIDQSYLWPVLHSHLLFSSLRESLCPRWCVSSARNEKRPRRYRRRFSFGLVQQVERLVLCCRAESLSRYLTHRVK